jgi:hypothetical protein
MQTGEARGDPWRSLDDHMMTVHLIHPIPGGSAANTFWITVTTEARFAD